MQEAADAQAHVNLMLCEAAAIAEQALRPQGGSTGDYVFAGRPNLMGFQELANVQSLRNLIEAIDTNRELLHLFAQWLNDTRAEARRDGKARVGHRRSRVAA